MFIMMVLNLLINWHYRIRKYKEIKERTTHLLVKQKNEHKIIKICVVPLIL